MGILVLNSLPVNVYSRIPTMPMDATRQCHLALPNGKIVVACAPLPFGMCKRHPTAQTSVYTYSVEMSSVDDVLLAAALVDCWYS